MTQKSDKDDKKPFFQKKGNLLLKIFVLVILSLLAAKFIFDYEGFWAIFGKISSSIIKVLSYVLVGFIIAYVLDAFEQFLEKKLLKFWKKKAQKFKRVLCIVLSYLFFVGIVALILVAIIPRITESLGDLAKNLSGILAQLRNLYDSVMDGTLLELPQSTLASIDNAIKSFVDSIIAFINASRITSILTSTAKVVINALLGIMISIYMLIYKSQAMVAINRIVDSLFSPANGMKIRWAGNKANEIFHRYFTGKILQALIVITLAFIIFTIARIPYALLFAVIIGTFNMIPYVGPWIGSAPVVLVCLSSGWLKGAIALGCVLVIQIIDNTLISPRVLGDSMGVNPLAILIGLGVGGKLFGVVGVVFGDVIAALAKVFLYDKLLDKVRERREAREVHEKQEE